MITIKDSIQGNAKIDDDGNVTADDPAVAEYLKGIWNMVVADSVRVGVESHVATLIDGQFDEVTVTPEFKASPSTIF